MGGMELTVANSLAPASGSSVSEVFVAAVALTATKGPPQLLMSTVYSLSLSWDLQHFMVLSTSPAALTLPSHQVLYSTRSINLIILLLQYHLLFFF